jgi:predicted HTH transcriptional regulator
MLDISEDDLYFRLGNTEDTLVERKTFNDAKDWLKTVVAFANSAPIGAPAVLFIGVRDDGTPEELPTNWDTLQRKLGEKLITAYPNIPYITKILNKADKQFLAIIVLGSPDRPHFAGPSYVRQGPTTKVASLDQFDRLIAERNAKAYEILRWRGKTITVDTMNVENLRMMGAVASTIEETVLDCNQFYVTLEGRSYRKSIPLGRVEIAFDQDKQRLKLEIRPV